jgi:hypothetical protein
MTVEGKVKISADKSDLANKLAAVGWGIFLIWAGAAMLLHIDPSLVILGIGFLVFVMQGIRKYKGLRLEVFWLVIGAIFIVGGLWEMLGEKLPMVPVMLIAAGVVLIAFAGRGRYLSRKK